MSNVFFRVILSIKRYSLKEQICWNFILVLCFFALSWSYVWMSKLNTLVANPTKWLNTLKQFAGCSVLDHFVGLALKNLKINFEGAEVKGHCCSHQTFLGFFKVTFFDIFSYQKKWEFKVKYLVVFFLGKHRRRNSRGYPLRTTWP